LGYFAGRRSTKRAASSSAWATVSTVVLVRTRASERVLSISTPWKLSVSSRISSPSRVGHDVLGNAYEYLLKQFADESGKKAGARGVALFTRSRDGTYTFGEFNGAERKLPKFPSVSPSEAMSFVRATGAVPSGTPELVWAPTDVSGTPSSRCTRSPQPRVRGTSHPVATCWSRCRTPNRHATRPQRWT
jgi:hypothetical protein